MPHRFEVNISVSDTGYSACLDLSALGQQFQEYEGRGENLSDALLELSEQVQEAGL